MCDGGSQETPTAALKELQELLQQVLLAPSKMYDSNLPNHNLHIWTTGNGGKMEGFLTKKKQHPSPAKVYFPLKHMKMTLNL